MGKKEKKTRSIHVNKKTDFHQRIDIVWWKILSKLRTETKKSFKELVEDALSSEYGINIENESHNIK